MVIVSIFTVSRVTQFSLSFPVPLANFFLVATAAAFVLTTIRMAIIFFVGGI